VSHSFSLAVNEAFFAYTTCKYRYGRKILRTLRNLKGDYKNSFRHAISTMPLLRDEKTYNTSHPAYDNTLVRNYPGRIFKYDAPCVNPVFKAIKKLALANRVPDMAWNKILKDALAEAKTVPGSEQIFQRKIYIEKYIADMGAKYEAHYMPGWVNLEDALFLYWMIRILKPRTIVQTGVCNGLSTAFMMLALAKNGEEGTLHAIDLPHIFNPNDPAWTVKGTIYGVLIPEGKTSGWMVPDIYKNRFFVQSGDAKELLPKLVESQPSIDMFYHDSDHTYNHMMFEFNEAKKKLAPGGIIIGDDISWNASVWDFADQYGVPSYNFKSAVGVAFF
jgi:predicted O-methyltransferase YrrM